MTVSRTSPAHDGLGKVFIAGAGRSGTTVLHKILGAHPQGFTVPDESKLSIEGNGLRALTSALGDPCAVSSADLALNRFIAWTEALGEGTGEASERLGYYEWIGRDWYFPPMRAFVDAVTAFREGPDYVFPRMFADRAELVALAREMVSTLFGAPAVAAGKRYWVEKTPNNLLAMDFLWELFPDAAIIHVTRDPRAVLNSFMKQPWLPGKRERCAMVLADIYAGCWSLEPSLDLGRRRYLEVRLEDLVSQPREVLAQIARLVEFESDFPIGKLNVDRIEGWRTTMPADDRAFAERELAAAFPLMGYFAGEGRSGGGRDMNVRHRAGCEQ